jgi:hypothetical protein
MLDPTKTFWQRNVTIRFQRGYFDVRLINGRQVTRPAEVA